MFFSYSKRSEQCSRAILPDLEVEFFDDCSTFFPKLHTYESENLNNESVRNLTIRNSEKKILTVYS